MDTKAYDDEFDDAISTHINGTGISQADATEALVRWIRGDHMMAFFYLDKAGFHGIEALFGQIASTVNA